jgi:hypothetical protein
MCSNSKALMPPSSVSDWFESWSLLTAYEALKVGFYVVSLAGSAT